MGLEIIREAVGDDVLLDKDGSPMLNPVGIVDEGRISDDTVHSFEIMKGVASGIAERYYMNRKFFVSDPDAFTISGLVLGTQAWRKNTTPLTLQEAQMSIVLAAVSGGMYEIGDDLPTLAEDPPRFALVENQELLQMVKLGQAAVPIDLMTYRTEDEQPSVFLLHEDRRQTILAGFNPTTFSIITSPFLSPEAELSCRIKPPIRSEPSRSLIPRWPPLHRRSQRRVLAQRKLESQQISRPRMSPTVYPLFNTTGISATELLRTGPKSGTPIRGLGPSRSSLKPRARTALPHERQFLLP